MREEEFDDDDEDDEINNDGESDDSYEGDEHANWYVKCWQCKGYGWSEDDSYNDYFYDEYFESTRPRCIVCVGSGRKPIFGNSLNRNWRAPLPRKCIATRLTEEESENLCERASTLTSMRIHKTIVDALILGLKSVQTRVLREAYLVACEQENSVGVDSLFGRLMTFCHHCDGDGGYPGFCPSCVGTGYRGGWLR